MLYLFSHCISLGYSGLCQFLRYLVKCPSVWVCLRFSPGQAEVLCFGEEADRGQCNSQHIMSKLHSTNMIYREWCWPDLLAKVKFTGFSTETLTPLPPRPHCTFGKQVTTCRAHFKGVPPLRGGEYLHTFFGVLYGMLLLLSSFSGQGQDTHACILIVCVYIHLPSVPTSS